MIAAELTLADLLGGFIGLMLTLLVFSYLLSDNILFRVTIHIFIGVAAGFSAVVAYYNVIYPRLILPLLSGSQGERLVLLVPLVLSILLLAKVSPRLARWGNVSMAYLVGVGAAVAIGGALLGTLFPQVGATINQFDLRIGEGSGSSILFQFVNGSIILVGVLVTMAYFHFGIRAEPDQPSERPVWIEWMARVGKVFIAIAFGVLFAGVYSAALMALVERLYFLVDFIKTLVQPFVS
jgi:hypothetical protein